MNQITDGPNQNYTFGYDFDYAVWTANSDITLTNVPWNNDYRDIVYFDTTDDLNRYLNRSTTANITLKSTYAKINEPIMISTPFNVANRFNYVRVYNPAQPINGGDTAKYFYYFITDVRYIAPNTTALTVQLDIVQTYIRDVRFGRCFIERGHIGIANEDNFRNWGRDYLTVPEGLDVGAEYMPVHRITGDSQVMVANSHSILVTSTVDLEADAGTVDNPKIKSAPGGLVQSLPTGATSYVFTSTTDFLAFMRSYSNKPWVVQGIISISLIPPITRYYKLSELGAKLPFGAYKMPTTAAYKAKTVTKSWRSNANLNRVIPPRYRHLYKFYTFPYMAVEITNMVGQSSVLKPERINSNDVIVVEQVSLMLPGQRLTWFIDGYNTLSTPSEDGNIVSGYEYGVSISGLPSVAVANNGALLALANNAHSRDFAFSAASWSQQRALRGNEVSYDQASKGIQASSDLAENQLASARRELGINNQVTAGQALANNVSTIGTGAGGGFIAGGPAGAAIGAVGGLAGSVISNVGTLISQAGNSERYANMSQTVQGASAITGALGESVRDTNKSLSDWAARGDYENTIAGLNAKIQDAQMTPPSLVGQAGGETLGIINFRFGYDVRVLMPDQSILNAIGEYWLRYGYAVNRFSLIPQNLKVMTKFSYWKLKETYIRAANMPETFKQAIRGILEKGVTVWSDPDDIGVIDTADNEPLPGIKLDGYVPPEPEPDPDPEPPVTKKRNKKMLVFSSVDENPSTPGNVWALAGTSPGTDANWIETRDSILANQYLEACNVDSPVGIDWVTFQEYRDMYRGPVSTLEFTPVEG